jgi:hypothetical protein
MKLDAECFCMNCGSTEECLTYVSDVPLSPKLFAALQASFQGSRWSIAESYWGCLAAGVCEPALAVSGASQNGS